jgi:hypothetical protein
MSREELMAQMQARIDSLTSKIKSCEQEADESRESVRDLAEAHCEHIQNMQDQQSKLEACLTEKQQAE